MYDLSLRGLDIVFWVGGSSSGITKKRKGVKKMSTQNREMLKATIYNLASGSEDLYRELAMMTDRQLEEVINEILQR